MDVEAASVSNQPEAFDTYIKELLGCGYGQRLDFFEKNDKIFPKKEEYLKLADDGLVFLEFYLKSGLKIKNLEIVTTRLLKLKKDLSESRASPRLLAEICFLDLPENISFSNLIVSL